MENPDTPYDMTPPDVGPPQTPQGRLYSSKHAQESGVHQGDAPYEQSELPNYPDVTLYVGRASVAGVRSSLEHPAQTETDSEKPRNPRLVELFAPRDLTIRQADQSGNKERLWQPTEQTRWAAEDVLMDVRPRDEGLQQLLRSHASRINLNEKDRIVDAIREDASLRYDLGVHYLDKINSWAAIEGAMPQAIVQNKRKDATGGGYPVRDMRSREYAAVLCLAMLDGTFNEAVVSEGDAIAYGEKGEIANGQHRKAALLALGVSRSHYA